MEGKTPTPAQGMTVAADAGARPWYETAINPTVVISDAFMQDAIDAVLARSAPGTYTYVYITEADPRARLRTVRNDDPVARLHPDDFVLAEIAGNGDPVWAAMTDTFDLTEQALSVGDLRDLVGQTVRSFITYDLTRYDDVYVFPVQEGDPKYDEIVASLPPLEEA